MGKIRIAQSGHSIYEGDDKQILDEKFANFVVVAEGQDSGNVVISHPMGVPTAFFVWAKNAFDGNWGIWHQATMADANGNLTSNVPAGVPFKYILTQRKLNGAICAATPNISQRPGLVISENANIYQATWDQIKFYSGKRTLQIWGRNRIDASHYADNAYHTFTIPHGFNFTPAFLTYAYINNNYAGGSISNEILCDGTITGSYGGSIGVPLTNTTVDVAASADATNLYFRILPRANHGEGGNDATVFIPIAFDYIIIGAIDTN